MVVRVTLFVTIAQIPFIANVYGATLATSDWWLWRFRRRSRFNTMGTVVVAAAVPCSLQSAARLSINGEILANGGVMEVIVG